MRAWLYRPHSLTEEKHLDILDTIGEEVANRVGTVELCKVKAHIGMVGNERADTGAKLAASGTEIGKHVQPTVRPAKPKLVTPYLHGVPLHKPKQQLRPIIYAWMKSTYELGTRIETKWTPPLTDGLDHAPSNRIWRNNGDIPFARMAQTLRSRNHDLFCNAINNQKDAKKYPDPICPLDGCNEIDTWHHMATGCNHPDIKDMKTTRHDACCRNHTTYVRRGKNARWLLLVNAGKTDGASPDLTIPEWMLPADTPGYPKHNKPDFVIVQGWPSDQKPLPTGPDDPRVTGETRNTFDNTPVKLILCEFACCSDLRFPQKVTEKKRRYAPLIAALIAYGWNVDPELIVTTAGLRATVPLRNLDEFKRLGIDKKKDREALQNALTETTEKHLALIIRQQRKLRRTQRLNPTAPPPPPPEPPPD
jgi:hypothetical protein